MSLPLVTDSKTVNFTNTGVIELNATGTDRLILIICQDGNLNETDSYTVSVDGTPATPLNSYNTWSSIGRQAFIVKEADIVGTTASVSYSSTGNQSEISITAISISGANQDTPTLGVDSSGGFHSSTATNSIGGNNSTTLLIGWAYLRAGTSSQIDASNYPNQIPMNTITGDLYYGDAKVWSYPTGGSISADFSPSVTNSWILDGVQILEAVLTGPSFSNPTPVENKVGDVVSIDANNWFTSSGGPLDTWTEVSASLPAGLAFQAGDTGIIEGTLSEPVGNVEVTISCADDNGTKEGTFTWVISGYDLKYQGNQRLETPSGTVVNGAVSFSAYKGTIDTTLTGPPVHFPSKTVTDGVVTLSDGNLSSGTWTIFAQVDSDGTKLGASERPAE